MTSKEMSIIIQQNLTQGKLDRRKCEKKFPKTNKKNLQTVRREWDVYIGIF